MELVSNCCSSGAQGYEDYGICPDCKEHCDFIDLDMVEHQEGFIEGLEWALKMLGNVADQVTLEDAITLIKDKIEEVENELQ